LKKTAPDIKRKALLALDDDEEVKKRKIDKLPDLQSDGSLELANGHEEHENNEDRTLSDAGPATTADDEIDPLDAFMAGIEAELQAAETDPSAEATSETKSSIGKTRPEPEILRADDDDVFEPTESIEENLLAITSTKKKRDVPTVNWKLETLSEFQKNFYTQSAEITALGKEEVDDILREHHIVIRGKNKPKPILRWTNAAFPKNVMDIIENLRFEKPTPIQSVTLPTLMSGRDCIAIAQTGSGKTLGYVLPMLRHIQAQPRPSRLEAHAPAAFILVPTRELAQQVYNNAKPFMKGLGLRMVTAYGGSTLKDQIGALKIGADAVVCTPGRAIELLILRKLDLRRVTFLVLDEADRMLDMGFEPQISKISANIRPDRQTSMFSATFPKKMQTLAEGYLRGPIELIVGGRSTIPKSVEVSVEVLPETEKFTRLMEILSNFYKDDTDARTLVFVEQQKSADDLLNRIMKSGMGIPCNSIHGSKPQDERIDAIADFKSGALPLLIATSVAARGLDIEQLQLVIQYDPANHTEDNIHRIGRTGRAGRPGKAITFISEEQARFAEPLAKALRVSEREIPSALSDLVEFHDQLVDAGKAEKTYGGFGGRGIDRLDKEYEEKRRRERQQAGFDDDRKDEKEFEEDIDKDMAAVIAKASGGTPLIEDPDIARFLANYLIGAAVEEPAVQEQKKSLIDQIKYEIKKTEVATDASPAPGDARSAAEIIAQKINSRLMSKNQIRSGQSLDNKGRMYPLSCPTNEINIRMILVQHSHTRIAVVHLRMGSKLLPCHLIYTAMFV
jgi:ATP-dependent RNA helicase DDX46/PRP5